MIKDSLFGIVRRRREGWLLYIVCFGYFPALRRGARLRTLDTVGRVVGVERRLAGKCEAWIFFFVHR